MAQSNYDTIREDYLKSQGNYLVRYDNDTVYQWPENVIADLELLVKELSAKT
ncbi:MAG: DUF559 domain-containing protein [Sphingobacteriales bacterium]|nr:DUF559 domain-containing protein [Sphingobacteriales bacterium]